MASFDMRAYARRGAEARPQELKEELEAIYSAFPELREMRGTARRATLQNDGAPKGTRKRRKMTAAQRKAVGARMKKYWAARRAASASKKR